MVQVKQGDTVKVHYTGKLPDGTTFDSSEEDDPLEFTVGANEVIPGFETAVLGMAPGETKTATIPSEEAYGPYEEEMLLEVEREQFPDDMPPQVGQRLEVRQDGGETFSVVVTEVDDESVTLDANHPLAGQDLTFDIRLLEIV